MELQARAHLIIAESYLRANTASNLANLKVPLELSLQAAMRACEASCWDSRRQHAASLLAMARRVWGDLAGSQEAAAVAVAMQESINMAAASLVI